MYNIDEIVSDPQFKRVLEDPTGNLLLKAEDKLFDDYVQSDPGRSQFFTEQPPEEQASLRQEFGKKLREKYPVFQKAPERKPVEIFKNPKNPFKGVLTPTQSVDGAEPFMLRHPALSFLYETVLGNAAALKTGVLDAAQQMQMGAGDNSVSRRIKEQVSGQDIDEIPREKYIGPVDAFYRGMRTGKGASFRDVLRGVPGVKYGEDLNPNEVASKPWYSPTWLGQLGLEFTQAIGEFGLDPLVIAGAVHGRVLAHNQIKSLERAKQLAFKAYLSKGHTPESAAVYADSHVNGTIRAAMSTQTVVPEGETKTVGGLINTLRVKVGGKHFKMPQPKQLDKFGDDLADLIRNGNPSVYRPPLPGGTAPGPAAGGFPATIAPVAPKLPSPTPAAAPVSMAGVAANAVATRPTPAHLDENQWPIVELPVNKIRLSPDVKQFKRGANPDTGEVIGKELHGKFDRRGTGPIVIWERSGGEHDIITGRHRFALAKRSVEKTVPVQIVRENDGFTAEMAQTLDAELNIRDGMGEVEDYAEYFRGRKDLSFEDAREANLLRESKSYTGWHIGKGASDDLYAAFLAGKVSEAKAAAIGELAPGNQAVQAAAMDEQRGMSEGDLREYVKALAVAPRSQQPRAKQGDLFGFDDSVLREARMVGKKAAKAIGMEHDKARTIRTALSKGGKLQLTDAQAEQLGITDRSNQGQLVAALKTVEDGLLPLERWHTDRDLHNRFRAEAGLDPLSAPVQPDTPQAAPAPEAVTGPEAERPESPREPISKGAAMEQLRNMSKNLASAPLRNKAKSIINAVDNGRINEVDGLDRMRAAIGAVGESKNENREVSFDRISEGTRRNSVAKAAASTVSAQSASGPAKEVAGQAGPGTLPQDPAKQPPVVHRIDGTGYGAGWGGIGTPGDPVNDPSHNDLPIELPEAVQLAELLGRGALPQVRRTLDRALGRFSYIPGGQAKGIKLRADLFNLLPRGIKEKFYADSKIWAEATAKLNGLEGDAAAIRTLVKEKYSELCEREREARKLTGPVLALKVLHHEIGHWIDFLPDSMVKGRGNIFGHIAAFSRYFKTMLADDINGQTALLTKKERQKIRLEAHKKAGKRPQKWDDAGLKAWNQSIGDIYADMIETERKTRGLVTRAEVLTELEPLLAWWDGAESMSNYYTKPEEMYAEAMSVFLGNPQAVAARAPKFFSLVHGWMDARAEFRQHYSAIQDMIRNGTVQRERTERLHDAIKASDEWAFYTDEAGRKLSAQELKDRAVFTFDRVFGPVYNRMRKAKMTGNQEGPVRSAIENYLYRATGHEHYMAQLSRNVVKSIVEAGGTWSDLSEYMFHKRVMTERADMANPLGWTPEASRQRLEEMQNTFGSVRWGTLERAVKEFWDLRQQEVFPLVRESGLFSPELLAQIEANEHYAAFGVVKNPGDRPTAGSIEEMLIRAHGQNIGAKIFKQFGTLQRVTDPAATTAMKDMSLMSAARRNIAKTAVVNMLRTEFPNEILEAKPRWNGVRMEIPVKDNERMSTLIVMRNGKPQGWYVPKVFAEAFENGNPIENTMLLNLMVPLNRGLKNLYTSGNYGFWPVAFARDIMAYKLKMPRAHRGAFGGPKFWRYMLKAMRDAATSVAGKPNEGAMASLSKLDWITVVDPLAGQEGAQQIERLMLKYGQDTALLRAEGEKIGMLARAWAKWKEIGQIFERTVKRAGRIYLDKNFKDMPEWRKQFIIHNYSGSPNFLQKGAANPYMDMFAMFYNPWKESLRSLGLAAKDSPSALAWNVAKYGMAPKIAMFLLASGALGALLKKLGADDEMVSMFDEIKLMYDYATDYDKSNYTVIPLGWADKEKRKVAYLRLPLAEELRIPAALFWKAINREADPSVLVNYMGGQLPAGNPIWEVPVSWAQYLTGRNPYDTFRGELLLDQDVMAARDHRGLIEMSKKTWNDLGGSLLYRFDSYRPDDDPTRLEKFLKAPVVSNLAGRWVKVSNRGVVQTLAKDAKQPAARDEARDRLDAREDIQKAIRTGDWSYPQGRSQTYYDYRRRAEDELRKNQWITRPEQKLMMDAPTMRQRGAIMQEMQRRGL